MTAGFRQKAGIGFEHGCSIIPKNKGARPIPNLAERPVLRSEMLRLLLWSHHGDFRFWP